MIVFEYVKWRNTLASGNNWTEINFVEAKTTLIQGLNGSGKSTFIDAFCFNLYGKPYRNINIPQLVNAINEKEMETESAFKIGPTRYVVRRGLKPNFFEIWQNGKLLDQTS